MSDLEMRFAHLLQPIRDLAANWHIDVAAELEDYLQDLDNMDINIDPESIDQLGLNDGSNNQSIYSLNFAEAALLIQGSACVYSKKVEYLYALLFQTLDRLIENKQKRAKQKENEQASSDQSTSQSLNQTIDEFAEEEMLPLDDLPESNQCDLDEESINQSSYDQARRSTLLVRMPAALAVKYSTDQSNQSNQSTSQSDDKYRISECFVHSSGALLLERRDASLIESINQSINQSIPVHPLFGNPVSVIQAHRQSMGQSTNQSASQSVERGIDFNDVDDHEPFDQSNNQQLDQSIGHEMKYNDDVPDWDQVINQDDQPSDQPSDQPDINQDENRSINQPINQPIKSILRSADDDKQLKSVQFASDQSLCEYNSINQSIYEPVDYYALLDPFNQSIKGKPFRKGKCYRTHKKDESVNQSVNQSINQSINLAAISNPAYQVILNEIDNQSIKVPYSAEFAYIYMDAINQRRKIQTRKRKERESSINQSISQPVNQPKSRIVDQTINQSVKSQLEEQLINQSVNDLVGFDDDDHEDFVVQSIDQSPNEWELMDAPVFDTSLDQSVNQSINQSVDQSYESLCRQYLDNYLKEADSMLASSELNQRVKEWNDRLIDCLTDQDSRPEFDIHLYEEKILENIQSINQSNEEKKDDDESFNQSINQSIVQFEDAVSGAPVYEICRLFLATLQLANNGNVEIQHSMLRGHERSINQSINQSTNQSENQSINQSINHDDERQAEWGSLALKVLSTEQKIPVRFNQSINQPINNEPIEHSDEVFDEMIEPSVNQSINQSSDSENHGREEKRKKKLTKRVALKDQSNNQSINQSVDVSKPNQRARKGKRVSAEID